MLQISYKYFSHPLTFSFYHLLTQNIVLLLQKVLQVCLWKPIIVISISILETYKWLFLLPL